MVVVRYRHFVVVMCLFILLLGSQIITGTAWEANAGPGNVNTCTPGPNTPHRQVYRKVTFLLWNFGFKVNTKSNEYKFLFKNILLKLTFVNVTRMKERRDCFNPRSVNCLPTLICVIQVYYKLELFECKILLFQVLESELVKDRRSQRLYCRFTTNMGLLVRLPPRRTVRGVAKPGTDQFLSNMSKVEKNPGQQ